MTMPTKRRTKLILAQAYQLVVVNTKTAPNGFWQAVKQGKIKKGKKIGTGGFKTHSNISYLKRNKRKIMMTGSGLIILGATTGGAGLIVGAPLIIGGVFVKRGISRLARYKKYRYVKLHFQGAKNSSDYKEMIRNMVNEHGGPTKALSVLMHYFRHKKGHNIATLINWVKATRYAYDEFKKVTGGRGGWNSPEKTCDDMVKAVTKMMAFLAAQNNMHDILDIFTGCYHYVTEEVMRLNREFDRLVPDALDKIYNQCHGSRSSHTGCGKLCYRKYNKGSKGMGKGNYSGSRTRNYFLNCLQDAAHSRSIFGHGSKNRAKWISMATGLGNGFRRERRQRVGLGNLGKTSRIGVKSWMEEIGYGQINPSDPLGGLTGGLLQSGLETSILSKNMLEKYDLGITALGFEKSVHGVASGLFEGLMGGPIGWAESVVGVLVEMGNSYWNKHRLKKKETLQEKSIKNIAGLNRLDILRANLKGGGLLEDWVDAFHELQKAHKDFVNESGRTVNTCRNAYHLARALLARQKALMEFAAPHRYVNEFNQGVVEKTVRMFERWLIMSHGVIKTMDDHFAHGRTNCDNDHSFFYLHGSQNDWFTLENAFGTDAKDNGGLAVLTDLLQIPPDLEQSIENYQKSDEWSERLRLNQ